MKTNTRKFNTLFVLLIVGMLLLTACGNGGRAAQRAAQASPTAAPTQQTAPTQPAPTQPAPTQPAPTQPAPTQPAAPTATQPAPTQPVVISTANPNTVDGIQIDDTSKMPAWLESNIGGKASQWHLITEQNYFGWEFSAKDGSGNAVLCAKKGEIHFGVWNASTSWWDAAIIENGACTYANKGEPAGTTAVDNARWYLYTLPTAARVDQMDGVSVTDLVEFPKWLSAHIGGQPDQWGIVLFEETNQFIGWEFDSRPATGNGNNATLCLSTNQGQLSFGAQNPGGWWDSITMTQGCTYAFTNDPTTSVAVDNARWFPPFK